MNFSSSAVKTRGQQNNIYHKEKTTTQGFYMQRRDHPSLRVNARYLGTCRDAETVSPMCTI